MPSSLEQRRNDLEDAIDPWGPDRRATERLNNTLRRVGTQSGSFDGCTQVSSTCCCAPLCCVCATSRLVADACDKEPDCLPGIEDCAYGGRFLGDRYGYVSYREAPDYGNGFTRRQLDAGTVCWTLTVAAVIGGYAVFEALPLLGHVATHAPSAAPTNIPAPPSVSMS